MMCSQPISSPVSSKMQAAPSATSMSKARPAAGLPVMPEVPSEPPQTVPTTSSSTAIGTVGVASSARALGLDRRRGPRRSSVRVPPAPWMTMVFTGRPLACDRLREPVLVEALAAERDQQHRADVGVGAEPLHHRLGVAVGVAAGKADHVHVAVAERDDDLARHMVGAFDEVADDDGVADALAPVGAEIALHAHAPPVRAPAPRRGDRSGYSRSSCCGRGRARRRRSPRSPSRSARRTSAPCRPRRSAPRQLVAERQVLRGAVTSRPVDDERARRRGCAPAPPARCRARRGAAASGRFRVDASGIAVGPPWPAGSSRAEKPARRPREGIFPSCRASRAPASFAPAGPLADVPQP